MEQRGCVLVNGGSRGIGAAIVRAFCKAGWPVAFTYQKSEEQAALLAEQTGALAICADSGDEAEIVTACRKAEQSFGFVQVLVNNAALSVIGLYTDMKKEQWERLRRVNMEGPMCYIGTLLPEMIRRKSGRIINISSMWGQVGASCEVHYSVTKAAMIGLTRALAKEVGPCGITVNAVAPGVIDTDMNGALTPDDRAALCEEIPLSRFGRPEEVAAAVLFLASEAASYITGQVIGTNGGMVV